MSSRPETDHRATATGEPMVNRLQRIVVATDGSPRSMEAVDFAVDLAAEHAAELMIVHVVPSVDLIPPIGIDEVGETLVHEPSAYDHTLLDDAAAVAVQRGVAATTELLGGSTADAIVGYADEQDADLIVLSSRGGHGPIAEALLGSVSLAVLKTSTRPVLIVRSPHQGSATGHAS